MQNNPIRQWPPIAWLDSGKTNDQGHDPSQERWAPRRHPSMQTLLHQWARHLTCSDCSGWAHWKTGSVKRGCHTGPKLNSMESPAGAEALVLPCRHSLQEQRLLCPLAVDLCNTVAEGPSRTSDNGPGRMVVSLSAVWPRGAAASDGRSTFLWPSAGQACPSFLVHGSACLPPSVLHSSSSSAMTTMGNSLAWLRWGESTSDEHALTLCLEANLKHKFKATT